MPDWLPSLPARNLGIALAQFRIVGHEAPRRLAALAWRTEIPKQRTLDKFLALATRQRRSWRLPDLTNHPEH